MNFIREKETQYILSNYKSMSHQSLTDYLLKYNYDIDCAYIFNSLPLDLQKILNDLAGEAVKANNETMKAYDEEIKAKDKMIKQFDINL